MLERSRSWTSNDLQNLIANKVQESVGLDYKVAAALGQQDSLKRDIAKDVSAFANSAGGILVYGMKEDGHIPTELDPIDPRAFSKEWLENVIISNVQPRIDDLNINPVHLPSGQLVYVVTVPQSFTAHQSPDYRYYKRFNFQSIPMEDYELRDVMQRARTPIIELHIESQLSSRDGNKDIHRYNLSFRLANNGSVAAQHIKVVLGVPETLKIDSMGLTDGRSYRSTSPRGEDYRMREHSFRAQLLFPLESSYPSSLWVGLTIDRERFGFIGRYEPCIEWTAYADDMAPRRGRQAVSDLVSY